MVRKLLRRWCGCEHQLLEFETRWQDIEARHLDLLQKQRAQYARTAQQLKKMLAGPDEGAQDELGAANGTGGGGEAQDAAHLRQIARQRGFRV